MKMSKKRVLLVALALGAGLIGIGVPSWRFYVLCRNERTLRQLLAEHPQDTSLWELLGNVLYKRERFAEAADAYRTAMLHDDSSFNSYYGLAGCLTRLGSNTQALTYMEAARQKAVQLSATQELSIIHVVTKAIEAGEFGRR